MRFWLLRRPLVPLQHLFLLCSILGAIGVGLNHKDWLVGGTVRYEPVGPSVENFALLDHNGKYFELFNDRAAKAIVLITFGIDCPLMQQYVPTIQKIRSEFENQGVHFFLIDSHLQDDRGKVQNETEKFALDLPVLMDSSQYVANALKITRTTEALVIDPTTWNIVYRGAIDDRLQYNSEKPVAENSFLENALSAFIQHRPIRTTRTTAVGCVISSHLWPREINYQHVAPILEAKCVSCHNSKGSPPHELATYEAAKAWAPMIRETIRTRRMPPWDVDSHGFNYSNDISLTDLEAGTIVKWVDAGTPEGEVKGRARPLVAHKLNPFSAELSFGPFSFKTPMEPDKQIKYIFLGRAPKTYILSGRQAVISDMGLVQHLRLVVTRTPLETSSQDFGVIQKLPRGDYLGSIFLVPPLNEKPVTFSFNSVFEIPMGSYMYAEYHLRRTGREQDGNFQIKLSEYKGHRKPNVITTSLLTGKFKIPPNVENFQRKVTLQLTNDSAIVQLRIHMHLRGMSAKFEAIFPNGQTKVLLSIPHYTFKNQTPVMFETPENLPAGTTLVATGTYNNSVSNPNQINAEKWVPTGPDLLRNEMLTAELWYFKVPGKSKVIPKTIAFGDQF